MKAMVAGSREPLPVLVFKGMRLVVLIVLFVCLACNAQAAGDLESSADTTADDAVNVVQGDPFATDGEDFSSMLEDAAMGADLDDDFVYFGGYLESRNQLSIAGFDEPVSLRQRLHLEGSWQRQEISVFGSLDADYEGAAELWDGDHTAKSVTVQELYATYDSDTLDVFAGRKIHRWGTGDGINPMDLINPLDVKDPVAAGNADNRLPVWLVSATVMRGAWALEGVFLPVGEVNELARQGNPWTPASLRTLYAYEDAGNVVLEDRDHPYRWFQDVEFGGKLTYSIPKLDVSLLYYSGYVDSPVFKREERGPVVVYRPEYPGFSAVGLNFAAGVGASSTLRGEMAYKPAYPVAVREGDGTGRRDLWQGVLGWDYDLDGKYYCNIQVFADIYAGNLSGEPGTVAGPRSWHGAAYEFHRKWLTDDLETGIRGKIYSSDDGTLTEIYGEYHLGDSWKLNSGVMVWTGSDSGQLGQYGDRDLVYLTLRYSF